MLVNQVWAKPASKAVLRNVAVCVQLLVVVAFDAVGTVAHAQDQGVPFKMQDVGEQVVNGVRIQGARVPVWTDTNGRQAGRPSSAPQSRADQDELNELARIGRPDQRYAPELPPQMAPARQEARPQPTPTPSAQSYERVAIASTAPSQNLAQLAPAAKPAAIRRRARTEDEELADLQKAVESAEADLRVKQKQIEERKKDEARRSEEARIAAEREVQRQRVVFQAQAGQMLSEAISAYVGQNGWESVEWNVGPDFRIKYAYSERPQGTEGMKDVLLRVLEPYGLSAELHRPNSVVEVYGATETASRK